MQTRTSRMLCFAFFVSFCHVASGEPAGAKVISYDVEATVRPVDSIVGVSLTCEFEKPDTVSHIEFLFSSLAQVQSIQCRTKSGSTNIPFEFAGKDTLRLRLPAEAIRMKTLNTKFLYGFPVTGDTLLMLDRGHRWYPLMIDQIARFKLTAEVPKGYSVLSAGNLVESRRSDDRALFIWQSTTPVFKLPLIVFRSDVFTMTSREFANKTIRLYSYRNDTTGAAGILAEAEHEFTFYRDLLGEYRYERLTLIEVPDFEGTNVGSGLLTVGSASIEQMKHGEFEGLALTIAQQWMGAGVFAEFGRRGFWFLSLSVPHYLRLMYVRETRGEQAFNESMQQPLAKYREFAGKDTDVPIIDVDFPNSREKGLVLYAKGPFVVSKLQKHMGEQQWQIFLKDLYGDFGGRILTYDEFRTHISGHDPAGGTLALLNKLMREKGMPEE